MKSRISILALGLFLMTAGAANAASTVSVLSGKTLGSGMAFHGQLGWPGISATLLGSMGPKVDFGGKASFLYGYEGITAWSGIPGGKIQGVVRLNFLERNRFNLGMHIEPGFFVYGMPDYFYGYDSVFGLTIPVGLSAGIAIRPELMLSFGLDLPMFAAFGRYGGLVVPVMIGGGIEYAFDQSMGLTFNLRGGPSAPVGTPGYAYDYGTCFDNRGRAYLCGRRGYYGVGALEAQIGLVVKL